MSNTPGVTKTGACLCGKIKFQVEGEAGTPLWCTICHCLNCKRRSGSALYTAAICPKNGFTITDGTTHLTSYADTMTDSTSPLTRTFCSICGSNLFNYTPLREDIVSISAGAFDDFEDFTPTLEQYCIHRAEWLGKAKGVGKRFVEAIGGDVEGGEGEVEGEVEGEGKGKRREEREMEVVREETAAEKA